MVALGVAAPEITAQGRVMNKFEGAYFGQKPPGNVPEIFLPEVFNQYGYLHGKLVFAPDGKEVLWVISSGTGPGGQDVNLRLLIRQGSDSIWLAPEKSFLSPDRRENGPCYSHDGKRVYYQSRLPKTFSGDSKDLDIWYRQRTREGWGEPVFADPIVNSESDESQPWVMADGSIIFCRSNDVSPSGYKGGSDIYYSQCIDGNYSEPVCYGPEINTSHHETEPAVSPDGSYMVFISNRPGGYSRMMNLYVSFRNPYGGWSEPKCLSHTFRIDNIWFPTISYDGKYLFFCGGFPTEKGYTQSFYYWVSTSVISEMNPYK